MTRSDKMSGCHLKRRCAIKRTPLAPITSSSRRSSGSSPSTHTNTNPVRRALVVALTCDDAVRQACEELIRTIETGMDRDGLLDAPSTFFAPTEKNDDGLNREQSRIIQHPSQRRQRRPTIEIHIIFLTFSPHGIPSSSSSIMQHQQTANLVNRLRSITCRVPIKVTHHPSFPLASTSRQSIERHLETCLGGTNVSLRKVMEQRDGVLSTLAVCFGRNGNGASNGHGVMAEAFREEDVATSFVNVVSEHLLRLKHSHTTTTTSSSSSYASQPGPIRQRQQQHKSSPPLPTIYLFLPRRPLCGDFDFDNLIRTDSVLSQKMRLSTTATMPSPSPSSSSRRRGSVSDVSNGSSMSSRITTWYDALEDFDQQKPMNEFALREEGMEDGDGDGDAPRAWRVARKAVDAWLGGSVGEVLGEERVRVETKRDEVSWLDYGSVSSSADHWRRLIEEEWNRERMLRQSFPGRDSNNGGGGLLSVEMGPSRPSLSNSTSSSYSSFDSSSSRPTSMETSISSTYSSSSSRPERRSEEEECVTATPKRTSAMAILTSHFNRSNGPKAKSGRLESVGGKPSKPLSGSSNVLKVPVPVPALAVSFVAPAGHFTPHPNPHHERPVWRPTSGGGHLSPSCYRPRSRQRQLQRPMYLRPGPGPTARSQALIVRLPFPSSQHDDVGREIQNGEIDSASRCNVDGGNVVTLRVQETETPIESRFAEAERASLDVGGVRVGSDGGEADTVLSGHAVWLQDRFDGIPAQSPPPNPSRDTIYIPVGGGRKPVLSRLRIPSQPSQPPTAAAVAAVAALAPSRAPGSPVPVLPDDGSDDGYTIDAESIATSRVSSPSIYSVHSTADVYSSSGGAGLRAAFSIRSGRSERSDTGDSFVRAVLEEDRRREEKESERMRTVSELLRLRKSLDGGKMLVNV